MAGIKFAALDAASPLGSYLNEAELLLLARSCSVRGFKEGESLPDSPFYIVLDGAVTVMEADTGDVVCTRPQWSFFTNRAGQGVVEEGVHSNGLSEASIVSVPTQLRRGKSEKIAPDKFHAVDSSGEIACVCRDDCRVLLVSSQDRLERFYFSCSSVGQDGYDSIVHTNLSTTLMEVPFIIQADVDRASLRKLGELCSYLALQEGEWIFEEGDAANCFYIIIKGAVEAILRDGGAAHGVQHGTSHGAQRAGSPTEAHHERSASESHADATSRRESRADEAGLGGIIKRPGETFGVASLVLGEELRPYGMVAVERSVFLVISLENFEIFMHTHRNIKPSIMLMTKRFLLQRWATLESSFFHAFTEEELERAAHHATIGKYKAGEVIYHRGQAAEAFHAIAIGKVQRDYLDGSPARAIPRDAYFGELGVLLPRTPNLATVTATEDTALLTISIRDWPKVVLSQGSKSAEEKRFEELRCCVPPLGYDGSRHCAPSWHSAQRAAEPARDLHFALQINLLLRLRRGEVSLDAMLMHPQAQAALFRFSDALLPGAVRPNVLYAALHLLLRVRIACRNSASKHMALETESGVVEFLLEQMGLVSHPDQTRMGAATIGPPPRPALPPHPACFCSQGSSLASRRGSSSRASRGRRAQVRRCLRGGAEAGRFPSISTSRAQGQRSRRRVSSSAL